MSETSPEVEKLMTNAVRARPKATASDKISKVEAPKVEEIPQINTATPETQLSPTDKEKSELLKLHAHFGWRSPKYTIEDLGHPTQTYAERIEQLKKTRDHHNNSGLQILEKKGITKHHLLEKGIKRFKVKPNAKESTIEGNTLILGRDHFNTESPLDGLHKLLDTNKQHHLSQKARSRAKEMYDQRNVLPEGEDAQKYHDAGVRWSNLSSILKHAPEKGMQILKKLKDPKYHTSLLQKLLDFKLKRGLR